MPKGADQEYEEQFEVEPVEDQGNLEDLIPDKEAPEPDDGQEELEDQDDDTTEDEAPDETPTQEPVKKYKVKGREYTLEELVAQGLLDNIVTQSEQATHYQDLYHGIKQQVDQQTQQSASQANQVVQPQPQIDPRQIHAAMIPHIQQAVQAGFFEPEFAEDYPRSVATQMYIYQDYMKMKQLVTGMYQYFMRENNEKLYQAVQSRFNSACDTLTTKHPVYAGLKSPDEREQFYDYLSTKVNPEAGAINEEFLGRIYLAFQQDNILPAIQQGTNQRVGKRKKQKKFAAGEGAPAPRKDMQHKAKPSDDEAVMTGLMEHFNLS